MEIESICAKFEIEIEQNDEIESESVWKTFKIESESVWKKFEIESESVWTKVAEDKYALSLIFANWRNRRFRYELNLFQNVEKSGLL